MLQSILLQVLQYLGGLLLKWALSVLEKSHPGLKSVVQGICGYAKDADDKQAAIAQVSNHLTAGGFLK